MKKFLFLLFVFALFLLPQGGRAQVATSGTDRAFFNLKESVTELVAAKDKDDKNSLAYRIIAYKQVIDLSIAEAEDVRARLSTVIPLNGEEEWHKSTLDSLFEAIQYFTKERKTFNSLQVKSIDELKTTADRFRLWRENNYIGAVTAATDYIALKEAALALSVASMRREKIGEDLDAIPIFKSASRAKVLGELSNLLLRSRDVVDKGISEERAAYNLFRELYLTPQPTSTATSTPPASQTNSTSTATTTEQVVADLTVPTSTATTTAEILVQQGESEEKQENTQSIKDLVRSALSRVQETYQIYIEMSRVAQSLR